MLDKTEGIVLSFIRYRETSIICKIYTEKFGIQSYIINGIRSKTGKTKIALFQPLTLLDLVVYYRPELSINRISEIRCINPFKSIAINTKKTAIALMLSEVLNKTLKEESENSDLFTFIKQSILFLDAQDEQFENFHLHFLLRLSSYFGILPSSPEDMLSERKKWIEEPEKSYINKLLQAGYGEHINMDNPTRRNLLNIILNFYSIHIENFGELNSVKILREVLS
ncbi:MAG: DNA repair protein RecO [Cytophagaceae bacterium]